jgi:hypothetical protein
MQSTKIKKYIKLQSSAVSGARLSDRRLIRRVREWDRLNQMTLIDTDQNAHGCIRMANGAEKNRALPSVLAPRSIFSPLTPLEGSSLSICEI